MIKRMVLTDPSKSPGACQLIKPYISLKKKMVKFTTTGIYAGFSREASVHRTMSTISLVAKIREVTHTSAASKVNGSKFFPPEI